jgi:protein-S-isoprenylcysteine O-methyltransferase Ste14
LFLFSAASIPIQFGAFEFFGLKQIFESTACPILSRTTGMKTLVTDGMFQYCRHPMYLVVLLGFIISPSVSFDKLLFIICATVYLYIAIPIEEKKLEKIFGQAYVDYRKNVPAIMPNLKRSKKA